MSTSGAGASVNYIFAAVGAIIAATITQVGSWLARRRKDRTKTRTEQALHQGSVNTSDAQTLWNAIMLDRGALRQQVEDLRHELDEVKKNAASELAEVRHNAAIEQERCNARVATLEARIVVLERNGHEQEWEWRKGEADQGDTT